jgi:hypothetical protein
MPTVYTEVEVDVDLDDFTDDDLIDEMERRGLGAELAESTATELIDQIYQKRRLGQDYNRDLDQLIYQVTGRII